jgi:YVTN family beta-propeller protein
VSQKGSTNDKSPLYRNCIGGSVSRIGEPWVCATGSLRTEPAKYTHQFARSCLSCGSDFEYSLCLRPYANQLLGVIQLGGVTPQNLSPLYYSQSLVHGMGFSFDHKTLDVVSIGSNSVTFIDTATNQVKHTTYVGRSPHEAFFTPDDSEVWVTVRGENYVQVLDGATYEYKDKILCRRRSGNDDFPARRKVRIRLLSAQPPFNVLATLDTGPITNHVNIVRNAKGQFAYVTVGGENVVKVYTTTNTPQLVATIPTGELPHGIWPSGDGTRIYVALENGTGMQVIDTLSNQTIATLPGGQAALALVYVPNAVPTGNGLSNLVPLASSGQAVHLYLGPDNNSNASGPPTTVTLNY